MFIFAAWMACEPVVEVAVGGIEQAAVSDRPLGTKDLDALHLAVVAQGIGRFIRNPQTGAPLVLCIDGNWGGGQELSDEPAL
jgi:hypothetical protein